MNKKTNDLPIIEKPTEEELEFISYMGKCVADYIAKTTVERRTLIAALFSLCSIVFCHETNFKLEKQHEEIEKFCDYLKFYADKNKK